MARRALEIGEHGRITVLGELGNYRARTYIRDNDGKRRNIEARGSSKAKAETALKAKIRNRTTPTTNGGTITRETTIRETVQAWLTTITERGTLAKSSLETYRNNAQHITGHSSTIGGLKLREATPARLGAFTTTLSKTRSGAAKTVRSILRGALDLAIAHGAITTNPARNLPRAAAGTTRPQRDTDRVLTDNELARLLDTLDSHPTAMRCDLGLLVRVMLGTGCRIGEACALRWDGVHLGKEPTVTLGATVWRIKGEGLSINERGKSANAVRTLHISDDLAARLLERRVNDEPNDLGLVLPAPISGGLRDMSNTAHQLKKVFNAAGITWATSHTLRHTAATRLAHGGITAEMIRNQLGHADARMAASYVSRRQAPRAAATIL